MEYIMKRNLDGNYFEVNRNGFKTKISFTDMTYDEQIDVIKDMPEEKLKIMVLDISKCIRDIGDKFDIVGVEKQ